MTPRLNARLTATITLSIATLVSGCARETHAPAASPRAPAPPVARVGSAPSQMLASNARKTRACPSGQKMDEVLRLCMPTCPGGAASAAGFCMQAPKTSGCGCGKLHDRLTGQCTRACPNGSQPYAGVCGPGM